MGTVRTITDQTKILALNATIEAVKAGAFGRGFAVVADEVKKLSQDTALATRDVKEKIEAINSTCQTFIASFDCLDNGADTLQQVTRTIDQAVERQRSLTGAIVDLSAATGENTREVSTRIAEVNSAATSVLDLARNTRHHAENIATTLGQLLGGSVSELGAMCGQEGDQQPDQCSVWVPLTRLSSQYPPIPAVNELNRTAILACSTIKGSWKASREINIDMVKPMPPSRPTPENMLARWRIAGSWAKPVFHRGKSAEENTHRFAHHQAEQKMPKPLAENKPRKCLAG